ncbi:hypothetical protein QR680_004132 [Steinernema hermaphroditum]|uniref:Uncharacterized protein n=1 Tax=Steinernema hermaphroditum TaxID=289476 RepID=A0AA39HMR3_9BILA|nr:hypothetical protein QR680_004132 [Steinernema hermaphroditum]
MLNIFAGVLFLLIGVIGTPLYGRVLYILIKKHSSSEVYRLMAHIGVVQMAAVPGLVLSGLMHLIGQDVLHVASTFFKVFTLSTRVEALLSFELAVMRLEINCNKPLPDGWAKVTTAVIYIYAVLSFFLTVSPWCDYEVYPGKFAPSFNTTQPACDALRITTDVQMIGSFLGTFLVYAFIVRHIYYTGNVVQKNSLVNAGVRFAIELVIHLVFMLGFDSPAAEVCLTACFGLNSLVVPVVLHLIFNKPLRKAFNPWKKTTAINVQVVQFSATTAH